MSYKKILLGSLAGLLVCSAAYCEIERSELLPPECAMRVRVTNSTKFIEQFKKSSISRLWSDPQMREVFGKKGFVESLKEDMAKDKNEELAHLEWQEMIMLSGEIIVALRPGVDEPLVVAYMSKEDYKRSLDMDKRIAELRKDGETLTVKQSTFQGAPLVQLISEKMKDGEKVETTTWQTHVENTLISAESREYVEKSIVKARKEGIKEPTGLPALDFQMSIDRIIEEMEKKMPPPPPPRPSPTGMPVPQPPTPRQVFTALGLDAMEKFALGITLKDDEMVLNSHIYGSDLTRGIFKLLVNKPSSFDLTVPFVPEGAFSYEVSRMDLRALWLEVPNALTALNPMYAMQYHFVVAALLGSLGVDIDKELLAHLDTQYIAFATSEDDEPVSVTCVRLNDEDAVKATLAKMFSDTSNLKKSMGENIQIEEFRGSTMYIFKAKQPPVGAAGGPAQPPAMMPMDDVSNVLSVGGGYMFYGVEAGVRMVLRSLDAEAGSNNEFYSTPIMRELRRLAPDNCIAYAMVDWPEIIKAFLAEENRNSPLGALKLMTSSGMAMQSAATGSKTGGIFSDPDFSKLPSAAHMATFFGPSFSYNTRDIKGIHGKVIMRYRPLGK